jgi:hypothetical protein
MQGMGMKPSKHLIEEKMVDQVNTPNYNYQDSIKYIED